jgi:indole-3-glycerol phosphate synthase
MHILDKIVEKKKLENARNKSLYPIPLLEQSTFMDGPTVSLSKYLLRGDKSGIIAEFKRKSPSRPSINLYADVEEVTIGYMQAGASALSILTDNSFFGGSSKDLTIARKNNFCPILRKDFIIDEYQIIEARSIGADAILLICEILTVEEVKSLAAFAKSLGMEVLLELHSEEQLKKVCEDIDVIGVNNRDLKVFKTDLNFSRNLFSKLPQDKIKISESGIHNSDDVVMLRNIGYQGFLIGEKFMSHSNPAQACMEFINEISQKNLNYVD